MKRSTMENNRQRGGVGRLVHGWFTVSQEDNYSNTKAVQLPHCIRANKK